MKRWALWAVIMTIIYGLGKMDGTSYMGLLITGLLVCTCDKKEKKEEEDSRL